MAHSIHSAFSGKPAITLAKPAYKTLSKQHVARKHEKQILEKESEMRYSLGGGRPDPTKNCLLATIEVGEIRVDGFATSRDVHQHGPYVVFVEELSNLLVSLTIDFSFDCGYLVRGGSSGGSQRSFRLPAGRSRRATVSIQGS